MQAMQADDILGAVGLFADDGFVYASHSTMNAVMLLARARFGQWAVDRYIEMKGLEEGYASLPAMIADDAKKFGMWCLDLRGASRRNTPGDWSEGRIQRVAIDGLADGELVAIVEGYGDNLSDALGSALHADGTRIPHVPTATGGDSQISRSSRNKFKCIVRSRGHQICRMTFASQASALRATVEVRARNTLSHHWVGNENDGWQLVDGPPPPDPRTGAGVIPECYRTGWDTSGDTLAFQYGNPQQQSYGISAPFLRKNPGQTWDAVFRDRGGPLPQGASRRHFVPRPLQFPRAERTPRQSW